jgi:hypothetical protein
MGRKRCAARLSMRSLSALNGSHISRLSHPHWSTAVPVVDLLSVRLSQSPVMKSNEVVVGGVPGQALRGQCLQSRPAPPRGGAGLLIGHEFLLGSQWPGRSSAGGSSRGCIALL